MSAFVPDFGAITSVVVEDFDGSALRAFKDCHRGERCFVLGNGPSLQRTDLAPLADEITIGVNGIFYMTWQCGFAPTYYVVEDNHVFSDNLTRIENVSAVAKFFPSKYRPIIAPAPDVHFLPTDWGFYWGSSPWFEQPRFSHDVAEVIYAGQTVTFLNLQLAAYMGCTEIYLVGVDHDYQVPEDAQIDGLTITSVDDDPNHFHPAYFGRGKKWHLPKLDNVGKAMLCARDGAAEVGATISNATVGGKLELLPRVDYVELVGRPALDEPNAPAHYLLSRALAEAARLGAQTVHADATVSTPAVEAIVAAAPLGVTDTADADVLITSRGERGWHAEPGRRRTLILPHDISALTDQPQPAEDWMAAWLVGLLVTRCCAFWTRSLLELSPDGESILVPALGRRAHLGVDRRQELDADGLDDLDESRPTRWTDGRALSIDQLCALAAEIHRDDHSVGIVDGYAYVQSRWNATESPAELLARRGLTYRKEVLDGLRS